MKVDQRLLYFAAFASMWAAAGSAQTPQPKAAADSQRPNVIIILADDLGYGDLGCYGAKGVTTPNVDRLAQQGTRFTNTHAVASTSTPSRYSLLTGEYNWRKPGTDVAPGNAGMIIRPEQFTLADVFKSSGYSTAAIGKWHLGLGDKTGEQDWNAPLPAHPGDLGFDHSYIMAATADRVPCVFIRDGWVENYDPSAPIYVNYHKNFEGEPTGAANPELLYNQKPSHGHDQSIVNGISRIGYMKGGGKALWKDEDIADSIAADAVRFIEQQARDEKPFFMYLCTNDVHVPRFPHERFRGASTMGVRGDAIAQFDWTVGHVMNALDSLGIADNTLVILSSDNGPVLDDGYDDQAEELVGEHSPTGGLRGAKYSCFEGGTRVPYIVRWPGKVKAGATSDELLSHIDMLGSMAQLTNTPIPQGSAPDSRAMLASMIGNAPGRPYVIEDGFSHAHSVRTPQWKYIEPKKGPKMIPWGPKIETGNSEEPQLYEVTTLDGEAVNQAAAHPEIVEQLQAILARVVESGTDR